MVDKVAVAPRRASQLRATHHRWAEDGSALGLPVRLEAGWARSLPCPASSAVVRRRSVIATVRHHRQHNVVKVFLEFENKLNARDLVGDAEVNRPGGTEEIHRVRRLRRPLSNVLEVEARLFFLKQNPHHGRSLSANSAWHRSKRRAR